MGNRKHYKAEKRDFKKEITKLVMKQAMEENKKYEEASKIQKFEEVGTSAGASKVGEVRDEE